MPRCDVVDETRQPHHERRAEHSQDVARGVEDTTEIGQQGRGAHSGQTPMNIAEPPSTGVGSAWTVRSPGRAMAPTRRESHDSGGTAITVATTETASTMR